MRILWIILVTIAITFGLTKYVITKDVVESYKGQEEMVIESFAMGCQIGYVKNINFKDVNKRVKFCSEYLRKNPRVLEILQKKAKWVMNKYEK